MIRLEGLLYLIRTPCVHKLTPELTFIRFIYPTHKYLLVRIAFNCFFTFLSLCNMTIMLMISTSVLEERRPHLSWETVTIFDTS